MKAYFTLIYKTFLSVVLVSSSLFPAYSRCAVASIVPPKVVLVSGTLENSKNKFSPNALAIESFAKIIYRINKEAPIDVSNNHSSDCAQEASGGRISFCTY
jgi:hypothetical protein